MTELLRHILRAAAVITAALLLPASGAFAAPSAQAAANEAAAAVPQPTLSQPGAQAASLTAPQGAAADSLRISLITCEPGPEIFELYGHQAIRVSRPDRDQVYNYGVFDFNAPGFVYRFVKGETDYMCEAVPTWYFLHEYERRGSKVTEQVLNLTPAEASRLAALLDYDADPVHSTYRYKYCTNNCATRVLDRLDEALGYPVAYPDGAPENATYRDAIRKYNEGYPWYQLGIDLALGSGIDRPVSAREKMFVPLVLKESARGARKADGSPLVGREVTLLPGQGDMRQAPTPAYMTPLAASCLLLLVALWIAYVCFRRASAGRFAVPAGAKIFASIWLLITGLAGCLVWFLVFVSVHEATSPNLLAWWLTPLALALIPFVWLRGRRGRALASALFTLYAVAVLGLLCAWPLLPQNTNEALFPLMFVSLIVAATEAIMQGESSYIKRK